MLHRLVAGMDSTLFENEVISLTDLGAMAGKIEACGVRVRALGMKRGIPNPYYLLRLAQWLRQSQPQVIQTWMYHADLVGGLAANLAGFSAVVWNIRHSRLDLRVDKRRTLWTAWACARLSRLLPRRIVCCSETSRRVHVNLGYVPDQMEVIPNGFDLNLFKPDPAQRRAIREELGIPQAALVIGLIARFHPIKGHRNFVEAAGRLRREFPDARFLLCGEGVVSNNAELAGWIESAAIQDVCHLLGRREDIPQILNALDVATSASVGEAFPNVVAEAMACGVPCVVTDVGDSAAIVGAIGRVVPPRAPDALARAWRELLEARPEARSRLGLSARQRIEQRFALTTVIERYQNLYAQVSEGAPRSTSSRLAQSPG
ncbi:MAG: glycosyltransferase [Acidobacteria bacterium]|nr:glycosyltransferase [Acidobacteriota bacterium]